METVKTRSSNGNGGNIKATTTKSNFHNEAKRVSVKDVLIDHFGKTR